MNMTAENIYKAYFHIEINNYERSITLLFVAKEFNCYGLPL